MKTEQAWNGQYRVDLLVVIMGSTALVGSQECRSKYLYTSGEVVSL